MKKILALLLMLLPAVAQAQIVGTLPFQLQNGTTADATQVMADFNKILNDVNINAAKNGVNTDITALNALVTPLTPAQGGSSVYFASTSSGSANAQIVATPSPVGFTLSVGKRITFLAGFTNTGAMQLNVNGTGLTNVFRYTPTGPIALIGGEVVANNYIEAVYDGTRYLLYTNAIVPGYSLETSLASATTTDLGTISSHVILITGTTTITSFGSSALLTYPVYRLRFSGVLTLTNNAAIQLPGGANITTASGDTAVAQYAGGGNWAVVSYDKISGAAVATAAPTRQVFLSGSGTYTTPANTRYIRIRLVGAGSGGGGGNNSTTAAVGGDTCWNTTGAACTTPVLRGSGGAAGASAPAGGGSAIAGGAATGGNIANIPGGAGQGGVGTLNMHGGQGGSSVFGGNGAGGATASGNALAAATNSGGGGGGGGGSGAGNGAAGGGAGGYVEHVIGTPAATYTYAVGAGSAGITGTSAGNGAAGAAGQIIVEEYY